MADETGVPLTGINGNVQLVAQGGSLATIGSVRKWSVNRRAENQKYATNSTAGFKKTAKGIRDWDGSVDMYFDDGDINHIGANEGDLIDILLQTATSRTLTGMARIDSIEGIEGDIEGSGLVGATLNFSGHGAYSINNPA